MVNMFYMRYEEIYIYFTIYKYYIYKKVILNDSNHVQPILRHENDVM